MVVVIYLVAVQKINVHWFRIKKPFGLRLTSIFVGARHFATPLRQRSMSAEELHKISILLNILYLVIVLVQINKNIINTPNLLVSEACRNGIYLALLGPISFLIDDHRPMHPIH